MKSWHLIILHENTLSIFVTDLMSFPKFAESHQPKPLTGILLTLQRRFRGSVDRNSWHETLGQFDFMNKTGHLE